MRRAVLTAAATLALAGCTAPKPSPPRPAAPPPPATSPAPPPPSPTDWRDVPLTPGSWAYPREAAGSTATYGVPGAVAFALRCDPAHQLVTLTRPGGAGTAMTIQTSYTTRTIPGTNATGGSVVASLAARDPVLDQIAFSRGRFSVAVPGLPTLYLPAWAEPARVIEDCR